MATWEVVKAQARDILGIDLTDADSTRAAAGDRRLWQLHPGAERLPAGGLMNGADGISGTADDVLVEGNPAAPISLAKRCRTGHAFLDDIAHNAVPLDDLGVPADSRRRRCRPVARSRGAPTTTSCSTRTTLPATAA